MTQYTVYTYKKLGNKTNNKKLHYFNNEKNVDILFRFSSFSLQTDNIHIQFFSNSKNKQIDLR